MVAYILEKNYNTYTVFDERFGMAGLTMYQFNLGDQRISVLVTDSEQFLQTLREMPGIRAAPHNASDLVLELDGTKSADELMENIQSECTYVSLKTSQLLPPRVLRVE